MIGSKLSIKDSCSIDSLEKIEFNPKNKSTKSLILIIFVFNVFDK